jgi:hypothetical protein
MRPIEGCGGLVEIKPIDQTVKTLLESHFYVIPRFQRPYSWDRENVADFWNDAIQSDDKDYFIGSFVVYRNDATGDATLVVDGQQRLTTITLLLCALRDAFAEQAHPELAKGIHQLIERPDIDNKLKFVLFSETPYPYLQEHIQKFGVAEVVASLGVEEESLKRAHDFLKLQVQSLLSSVDANTTVAADKKADRKKKLLIQVRDKLLRLQLILIQLTNEDEAYIIFETLNTRGKDLRVSDLVKNHLTRLMKPKNKQVDVAKTKWQSILEYLDDASIDIDVNRFLHHSWLSRKPYVPEKKLFKEIRKTVTAAMAGEYLSLLTSDSELYRGIVDPKSHKWTKEEKPIAASLRALNLFRVVQPVPMLLAILRAYQDHRLSLRQIRQLLRTMENFHFQFSAVTAQRTGGGTGQMFALGARALEAATTKDKADQSIKGFVKKLRERLPSDAEFEAGFAEISFTEENPKQKPVVKYLLSRIDEYLRKNAAVDYDSMTIEHLAPVAPGAGTAPTNVGAIGNLLLVTEEINSKTLANKAFDKKKAELKKAKVLLDDSIENASSWGEAEVTARTIALAKLSQEKVFKV